MGTLSALPKLPKITTNQAKKPPPNAPSRRPLNNPPHHNRQDQLRSILRILLMRRESRETTALFNNLDQIILVFETIWHTFWKHVSCHGNKNVSRPFSVWFAIFHRFYWFFDVLFLLLVSHFKQW